MDYLLERVSPDDNEASDLVYRMYEVYEKGGFDVWDAVLLAEENSELVNNPESGSTLPDMIDRKNIPADIFSGDNPGSDTVYDSVYEGLEHMGGSVSDEGETVSDTEKRRMRVFPYILVALGLAGLTACVLIWLFIYLNEDEQMLLMAGGGASAVGVIAGIIMRIRTKSAMAREKREGESIYSDDDIYSSEHYSAIPVIHMEEFISQPGPGSRRRPGRQSVSDAYSDTPAGTYQEENLDDAGQTVFFDERIDSGSYKLYALDRKNKQHIELDSFPCTIGKLKGYVDCCIDHPSISRMHARIEKKDGVLLLKDTNSTNGTCINGIRLAPNEQRVIEVGDEIRFGSLNYALRTVGTDL